MRCRVDIWWRTAVVICVVLAGSACSERSSSIRGNDGQQSDDGRNDAGQDEDGSNDAGRSDGGSNDAGQDDAGGRDGPVVEPELTTLATPDVLARRLSELIWNTEPDSSVSQALQVSPLTRDVVARVADQMLNDLRAREGVGAFYRHWLLFEYKQPTEPLGVSLQREAPALGTYLTLDIPGTFPQLLTAPFTFVDETLARHYGIGGITGTEMQKVEYPVGEPRVGIMSGAGVLAQFSSLGPISWPAKRSWMVTDPLLCTPVIRSFLTMPELDPSRSIRQQMIDFTASPACMECHKILNSPGFAFIGFDSMGRWHPEAGAAPNETQGWIPDVIMPDAPTFDGPASLATLLAGRDETRRCFVRQWLQYAVDRSVIVGTTTAPADAPSVEVALRAFAGTGYNLRELIVAITRTNSFLR